MTAIAMFDDVTVSLLPAGYSAYAGYVNGRWQTKAQVMAKFPSAFVLTITISASQLADCLDIEKGDATNAQAANWIKSAIAAGIWKPVVYTSASNVQTLENTLSKAGIARSEYRVWSAHYTDTAHICGSDSYPAADATQWTSKALGRSLDESECSASFINPETKLNASGDAVEAIQRRLNAHGSKLKVDGAFGPLTEAAVKKFQTSQKISADGVVGPVTWTRLNP